VDGIPECINYSNAIECIQIEETSHFISKKHEH